MSRAAVAQRLPETVSLRFRGKDSGLCAQLLGGRGNTRFVRRIAATDRHGWCDAANACDRSDDVVGLPGAGLGIASAASTFRYITPAAKTQGSMQAK
jgi:hypothetical protein